MHIIHQPIRVRPSRNANGIQETRRMAIQELSSASVIVHRSVCHLQITLTDCVMSIYKHQIDNMKMIGLNNINRSVMEGIWLMTSSVTSFRKLRLLRVSVKCSIYTNCFESILLLCSIHNSTPCVISYCSV